MAFRGLCRFPLGRTMHQPEPALIELRMEVYRDCPVRCLHCYQAQTVGSGDAPAPLIADVRRFQTLVDDFVALGGSAISLTGGELLLPARYPRVRALILDLVGRGVREVRINSLLAFCNDAMLLDLAHLPVPTLRIQTGIDGPSVHDLLRFEGAQARTLMACRTLANLGVTRLSARTTLFFGHRVGDRSLDNLGDLDWILDACAVHGIPRLKTKVVHPSGTLAADASAAALWRSSSESLLAQALTRLLAQRISGQTAVRLLLTNPLPPSFVPLAIEAQSRDPYGVEIESCQCGAAHLAIDGEGNVFRCLYNMGRPDLSLGNVLREPIAAVLARTSRRLYMDQGQVGTCGAFDENLLRISTRKGVSKEPRS